MNIIRTQHSRGNYLFSARILALTVCGSGLRVERQEECGPHCPRSIGSRNTTQPLSYCHVCVFPFSPRCFTNSDVDFTEKPRNKLTTDCSQHAIPSSSHFWNEVSMKCLQVAGFIDGSCITRQGMCQTIFSPSPSCCWTALTPKLGTN